MLTVTSNISALRTQVSVSSVNREMDTSMQRLASGKRLNSARDDSAGVAISSRLESSVKGLNQSIKNSIDALALFDTAEGAMQEIEEVLHSVRMLAVQASTGTISNDDRIALNAVKTQLFEEISRIENTVFSKDQKLLLSLFSNKNFKVGNTTLMTGSVQSSFGNNGGIDNVDENQTPNRTGGEEIVNTEIDGNQERAHVTALKSGGYVVAWIDLSNTNIKAQVYNADGLKLGGEILVNSTTVGFQGWGDTSPISALNDGGFIITYQSPDPSGVGQFGQKFDSQGAKIGAEFNINSTNLNDQINASVSAFDDGGFVSTWVSSDSDGWGVFAQIFDEDGNKQGSEFQVNSSTYLSQWRPSVATLSNRTFVVTWESGGQDGDGDGIFGQIYNADGSQKGSEFQINSTTDLDQKEPTVKRLENDNFVVVWNTHNALTGEDTVSGQIFNHDGEPIFSEFLINTTASSGFAVPQVAATSDGGFVTVWRQLEFQGGSSDGSSYGIYGQRFDSTGSPLGSEFQLNTSTDGGQLNPSIVQLTSQELISVWSGPGDGNGTGIIKQKFTISDTKASVNMLSNSHFDIGSVSLETSSQASDSLKTIDIALQHLNSKRAILGVMHNRLTHIINSETNAVMNLSSSISKIEDANYAIETTNLVSQQIIQQASLGMLAQANASKHDVMSLLRG